MKQQKKRQAAFTRSEEVDLIGTLSLKSVGMFPSAGREKPV
jgi:hypothetical protein